MKSSPRWLAKRIPLPSGVQSRTVSSAEWIVRRRTAPPAVGITIDVHVPLAIRGERDRSSIRREPRIDVAGLVHRQPLDVLAVLVGGPDVAKVSERHLAGMVVGIAHQPRLAGRGEALNAEQEGQASERQFSSWMSFRWRLKPYGRFAASVAIRSSWELGDTAGLAGPRLPGMTLEPERRGSRHPPISPPTVHSS